MSSAAASSALSSNGRLLVFGLDEMREVPRGRGVIVIGLDADETLVAVALTRGDRVVIQGTNRTGKPVAVAIEGEELAKHRLRPILMTTCAMVAGMLPMALAIGEGGEQMAPLGRAVIGGLIAATATTLFFAAGPNDEENGVYGRIDAMTP